jgi:putative PIN family toxin of toxin-antitoxin system
VIFVIDTNVLICAFLKPKSLPAKALDFAQAIGQISFSQSTLAEFKGVIRRPFFRKYFDEGRYEEIIQSITKEALITESSKDSKIKCRDENDIKFLEVAISVKADCIISGDRDLLVLNPFQGIPILNAADFLKLFG